MESINELKTLWEHSNDAFLILDQSATILYANPAIENVSGLGLKQILNKNIRDLLRERLINNSASLEAIKERKTTTKEINTFTGKNIVSTASPVINSIGRLHRVVCNIRTTTLLPRKKEAAVDFPVEMPVVEELGIPSCKAIRIGYGDFLLVFRSRKMKSLVELALRLGRVDSTVLIYGETGVGKELIARLIHERSQRAGSGNLVKLNCAAIPGNLIESELFGYEPGAFTGALRSGKAGFIEIAHGGTLFLDEISELPFEMQSKLLTVLQDREVIRVGGRKGKAVDLRIIAATNRDLEQMVKEGSFRKDLFYRLNVIPLKIPPLRERKSDIPALIAYFRKRLGQTYGISKEISPDVVNRLFWYPWPGNVRELESLVERLLITIPQQNITPACLPYPYSTTAANGGGPSLKQMVEAFELELISEALEQYKTNIEAAEKLGISLSSLSRKIRKLEETPKEKGFM
ncbi:MAG: sigma 54-interacting transcriptional regulator [Bacillota bacterium]